ncbi:ABC transporter permease [Kribbella sp. NBC_01245]|uniref:ABC transporter permease n=1 Tax=Kribbella sp. NBC_01245 TaxID=2903578 RepID=UPI002E29C51B|nr:ABC transporter permease [Kribbella sp. NBC_01245]
MSVIAVERIKLLSTRSPWWCMAVAAVLSIGVSALTAGLTSDEAAVSIFDTQNGVQLSQMVMTVMAALAVTTEYRFGTIRTSFQAVPSRTKLLLGKTAVVAGLAALVGLIASFGALGIGMLLAPGADLNVSGSEWRLIAGQGIVYALAAVIAVAVGALLRQSAAAVAILILWPLLVENLVMLIPKVGDDMNRWAPFANASSFINQGQNLGISGGGEGAGSGIEYALSPWGALLYFALFAAVMLGLAVLVTNKRDA